MKWNLNIQMQIAFVAYSVFFFENSFAFVVVFFSTDFSLKIITANIYIHNWPLQPISQDY